jgi:hypothetical protein
MAGERARAKGPAGQTVIVLRARLQQKYVYSGRWLGVYLVLAKSLAGAINLIFMVYPQKYKNCSTLCLFVCLFVVVVVVVVVVVIIVVLLYIK